MASSPPDADDHELANFVEQAPLVFHVEVATLSLSVDEWAATKEGMVLDTGMALNDAVVLRVGGKPAGRGSLVKIIGERGEGRVGVLITQKGDEEV
jgi:flagellar motor switch/type III secretory pathway protein FliN